MLGLQLLVLLLISASFGCVEPYPPLPEACFPESPSPASLARLSDAPFYSDRCCRSDREGMIEDCAGIFEGLVPEQFEVGTKGDPFVRCIPLGSKLEEASTPRGDQVCVHLCAAGGCTCASTADCCPGDGPCQQICDNGVDEEECEQEVGIATSFCLFCRPR